MADATPPKAVNRPLFPEGGALIIGGSGGIGRVVVKTLADYGADVAFTYFSKPAPAEALAGEIVKSGRKAEIYKMSLTARDEIAATVEAAAKALGGLHTLVYAAGVPVYLRYISQIEPERMAHHVESDIMGLFNLVQAALPHLRKAKGSIVVCGSCGVEKWPIKDALSVVPKSAMMALVRGVAREEGRFGIRANMVGTGVVDAGVTRTGVATGDVPESFIKGSIETTPLGRIGEAQDIAEAVAYLASSRAKFVTGQTLNVDGGWSL